MNPINVLILKAFLSGLVNLNSSLPEDLIQKINKVGDALANGDTDTVATLQDLAREDIDLWKVYESAYRSLHEQYQPQELVPPKNKTSEIPPPIPYENTILPTLTSPNPADEAKKKAAEIMLVMQSPL